MLRRVGVLLAGLSLAEICCARSNFIEALGFQTAFGCAMICKLPMRYFCVSGCLLVICNWQPEKLCCGFQAAYSLPIRQPENWLGLFQKVLHHDAGDVVQTKAVGIGGVAIGRDGVDDVGQILRQQIARAAGIQSHFGGGFA